MLLPFGTALHFQVLYQAGCVRKRIPYCLQVLESRNFAIVVVLFSVHEDNTYWNPKGTRFFLAHLTMFCYDVTHLKFPDPAFWIEKLLCVIKLFILSFVHINKASLRPSPNEHTGKQAPVITALYWFVFGQLISSFVIIGASGSKNTGLAIFSRYGSFEGGRTLPLQARMGLQCSANTSFGSQFTKYMNSCQEESTYFEENRWDNSQDHRKGFLKTVQFQCLTQIYSCPFEADVFVYIFVPTEEKDSHFVDFHRRFLEHLSKPESIQWTSSLDSPMLSAPYQAPLRVFCIILFQILVKTPFI